MRITDIDVDKEELETQLAQQSGHILRKEFIRKHTCNSCDEWATKQVTYQMGDSNQKITRIERYCLTNFKMIVNKQIQRNE